MLDPVHKSFHQVPTPILLAADSPWLVSVSQARNDRPAATTFHVLNDFIAVIGLVRDHIFGFVVGQEVGGFLAVVNLAGGHDQFDGPAFRVDRDMDLRAEPATRSPEPFEIPFFPAACWWARMVVESSIKHSRSGSFKASRIPFQTPRLHHRLNRWYAESHFPNRSGKSRQGAPVFASHITALMNKRLSPAVRPGSEALPGSRCEIRSHCSSEISWRRMRGSSLNRGRLWNYQVLRNSAT